MTELRVDQQGMAAHLRVMAIADAGLGHPENVNDYVEHYLQWWPAKIQEVADGLVKDFGADIGSRAVERFIGRLPVAAFVRLAKPADVLPLRRTAP